MIYLVCFFSSALFLLISEKLRGRNRPVLVYWNQILSRLGLNDFFGLSDKISLSWIFAVLFAALGLMIPSILAGLRDYSIGTDIEVYGNIWFEFAHNFDFFTYMRMAATSSIGLVYAVLNYIVALVAKDAHVFYFFLMLIELSLVYWAVTRFRDKISVPFAMLIYYFLFYNITLNILRQSLALAIMTAAISCLARNKNKQFLVLWMLAVFAHSSALLMIVLLPLKIYSQQREKRFNTLVLFCVTSVAMVAYSEILALLINVGILSERYAIYMGDIAAGGRMTRSALFIVISLLIVVAYPGLQRYDKGMIFLVNIAMIASALTLILFFGNNQIIRIAYYFDLSLLFILPMLNHMIFFELFGQRAKWLHIFVLLLLAIYWFITVVVQRNGETYPYQMM